MTQAEKNVIARHSRVLKGKKGTKKRKSAKATKKRKSAKATKKRKSARK